MCNRRRKHEGLRAPHAMMSVSWPKVHRRAGINVGVPGVSDLGWCAVNRCCWWRGERVADLFEAWDCDISLAQRQRPRRPSHVIASSIICLRDTHKLQNIDDSSMGV